MKVRTITGLMLLGMMVTAGAFAQERGGSDRYTGGDYRTDGYPTGYQNENYNYGNDVRDYYDGRYKGYYYNRYNDTRVDKRTRRQMRREDRNRYSGYRYDNTGYYNNRYNTGRTGTSGYTTQRYNSNNSNNYNSGYTNPGDRNISRYGDRDNDRYITDSYGYTPRTTVSRYQSQRSTYNPYDDSRHYDKRTRRQMRRASRNGYGPNYSNESQNYRGYDRQGTSGKSAERGIFRNNRQSNTNTRYEYPGYRSGATTRQVMNRPGYMYNEGGNYRNSSYDQNRGYYNDMPQSTPGYGYESQIPEGMMDYDTWMRNRNNGTGRWESQQQRQQYRQHQQYNQYHQPSSTPDYRRGQR